MNGKPRLHILGCGRAARAIGRRLFQADVIRVGQVANRSLDSARSAVDFIGAGQAVAELDRRIDDDWLMLGLPDGQLHNQPAVLAGRPELAFHLSGSVPSAVLSGLAQQVASVHPVRAFADPVLACERFSGTWCVAEGDAPALVALQPVFEAAGARWLSFKTTDKASWHAATVVASNFLITIQALARELAAAAGLPEPLAAEILGDLQSATLGSLEQRRPEEALTGPIERADLPACQRLLAAAERLGSDQGRLFSSLAGGTLNLARSGRGPRPEDDALQQLFLKCLQPKNN